MKELKIEAKVENLSVVTAFLCGLDAKNIPGVLIAAEEIFVNIASYAYKGGGYVLLRAGVEQDCFVMEFIDGGIPFDPLKEQDPDIDAPAESIKVGGYGIFIVKNVIDHISYERRHHENVLRIEKKLV